MLKRTLVITVVVILVAVGSLAYIFLKPPAEASAPIEAISVDQGIASEPGSQPDAAGDSAVVYEIVPAESEARFILGEILRGAPYTVVGVTDQVAGEFVVDAADLSTAQIGPVLVNARTLTTDSDFRNRAIKNQILNTGEYEYISFTPTEITNLGGSGTVAQSYNFQIVGDLTIRDITRQVTFEATASAISENQIQGSAAATIC
jgi:polyisoprenoid-binding protein YceI